MLAWLPRDVDAPADVADLKHLIAKKTFSPSQDPDATRILPSGLALDDDRGLVRRRQAFENFFVELNSRGVAQGHDAPSTAQQFR